MVMLVGMFAISDCEEAGLDKYKEEKKIELQKYADTKCVDGDYDEDGLAAISKAVADGNKAIEEAATKSAIDLAFSNAKNIVDEVEEKVERQL